LHLFSELKRIGDILEWFFCSARSGYRNRPEVQYSARYALIDADGLDFSEYELKRMAPAPTAKRWRSLSSAARRCWKTLTAPQPPEDLRRPATTNRVAA